MSRSVSVPDENYERAAKMAAEPREYISRRAARSSDEAFRKALEQIPDVVPEDYDRLDRS